MLGLDGIGLDMFDYRYHKQLVTLTHRIRRPLSYNLSSVKCIDTKIHKSIRKLITTKKYKDTWNGEHKKNR